MITSMELQRPRVTPILPQWDLGIVLGPVGIGDITGISVYCDSVK